MARNVRLTVEDLRELLTCIPATRSGERLRVWIEGELTRREKAGRLGGRTKRDVEVKEVAKDYDFGA